MLKKVSYKEQVYQYLKTALIKGELRTGEIYSEQQLADQLNVSRTPVREAVMQLTHEGMLEVRANRGWTVRPVSEEDLRGDRCGAHCGGGLQHSLAHCRRTGARAAENTWHGWGRCRRRAAHISWTTHMHYEFMKLDTEFHTLLVGGDGEQLFDSYS